MTSYIDSLINNEEVSDHTALLPTRSESSVDFDELTENEKKILKLLYQNLEEIESAPSERKKTTVTISYRGESFQATVIHTGELGWKKGDKISIDDILIEEHQTEPPEPFTDGKLLEAMEKAGIGTPATRANIIEELVSNGFAIRKESEESGKQPRHFESTELGRFLYEKLSDNLKNGCLTADWETKLSKIEEGEGDPDAFLEEIKEFINNILPPSK